ncbi:MAG TPA: CYCXC family (seleno)protein [Acidobacteriaceae bacterium]|nr:CYCXC family (seleno)protein [Acidobacteriaceae bacterium]
MRIILLALTALLTLGASAQWAIPTDDVPAYHTAPPTPEAKLAPVLTEAQLRAAGATLPWQFRVYALAARVPAVLYQLPCNCRCDRALGHASLQSCFAGPHGMECSTCAQEGVYAYRMTKLGKTPAQIRAGIAAHEYETINLTSLNGAS